MSDTVVTYVLWDEYEVKVGSTQEWRVEKRRRALQTGNPHKLRVIALCDRDVEKEVQTALRPWRLNSGPGREWFSTPDCARELSNQLVVHEFRFQRDWDLFQRTCLANRQMRRAGGSLPERQVKASSRAYETLALGMLEDADKMVALWVDRMLNVLHLMKMARYDEALSELYDDAEGMLRRMLLSLDATRASVLLQKSNNRWQNFLAQYEEATK